MGITSDFHNALILSIVAMTSEEESIFDFIKLMISETNWILSPGDAKFGPSFPALYVKKYLDGKYCYPLEVCPGDGRKDKEKKRIPYRNCLIKIDEYLRDKGGWDDITWFDFMVYLLFIQSNCHHKGHINSAKLCRNSNAFLNFFYKSKDGFNPWSQWERPTDEPKIELIEGSKKVKFRGEWWVKAFEREKKELLMFQTLAPNSYLGNRFTTGWFVRGFGDIREGDLIPYGSVLNQLRKHYDLPLLSGDYGLGSLSRVENVNVVKEDKENKENKEDKRDDIQQGGINNLIYVMIGFSLGFVLSR